MIETDIEAVMPRLEPYLDSFDAILRHGHAVYERYPPEIAVDHDASTQAHCTNRHILAEAHRIFGELPDVRSINVNGLQVWLLEASDAVVRFKKTDENGAHSNYQTQQIRAFDRGDELPGLPSLPVRVTVGYLLNATGTEYVRSQISLPTNRGAIWCAAIVPPSERDVGKAAWYEVTRQGRFSV